LFEGYTDHLCPWPETNISFFRMYKNEHRDGDNPAFITINKQNKPIELRYKKNGIYHRDNDKPADIKMGYTLNDEFIIYSYYSNGKHFRNNKNDPHTININYKTMIPLYITSDDYYICINNNKINVNYKEKNYNVEFINDENLYTMYGKSSGLMLIKIINGLELYDDINRNEFKCFPEISFFFENFKKEFEFKE
jgi:hypothetical protein